jgi:predicted ATPase
LRVRYPDLPAPTEDELTAKVRLFEAMARLLDALAKPAPLVLLLDDLQWADGDSLDLLRYLARFWKGHGTPVLLLGTVRREELKPELSTQLADLGRDLPITQVILQGLSQAETLQLVQAIVGPAALGMRSGGERRQHGPTVPATTEPEPSTPLIELGEFLFAHTGGHPFYLLETLKLLRDQQWLVPRLAADGTWQLELAVDRAAALREVRSRRGLVPASVRALILARLAKLSPAARQLVMASAVLGQEVSAELLWQLADLGEQAGLEALEEAVKSGFLREEEAEGPGADRLDSYRFAHELIRDVVYIELGEARRHLLLQRALPHGEQTMELQQEASAHLA